MKVLLSIKPQFVEEIFKGTKKFEYRKAIFKNPDVKTIVIYSTMPVGKIVGEFSIANIYKDSPDQIWEKTKNFSGIESSFFDEYFQGRDQAYAIEVSLLKEYSTPICPYKEFDKFTAPQSFMYIDNSFGVVS